MNKHIGAPIPVTSFNGTLCSLFGDPLEKDTDGIEFEYKEKVFEKYDWRKHKQLRAKNGHVVVLFPGSSKREERFLICYKNVQGELSPIVEVSDAGRACSRARRWAQELECDFQEKIDGRVVADLEDYRKLIIQLGEISII